MVKIAKGFSVKLGQSLRIIIIRGTDLPEAYFVNFLQFCRVLCTQKAVNPLGMLYFKGLERLSLR